MNKTNNTGNDDFIKICHTDGVTILLVSKFPSSLSYAVHLTACVLSIITILLTICLNSLTVLTFWRTPRLRENASLYLVMVLSLVDTGIAVICHPTQIISMMVDLMHSTACWANEVQSKAFRPATVLTLSVVAAISVERYFGVVHPLIHRTKITKGKLSKLLLLIWAICAVISFPAYFDENPAQIFTAISMAFLLLTTVCSYARIACTVIISKIRREKLRDEQPNAEGQESQTAKISRKDILHFLKELKMAKSSFLIVLCYLLCYTPTLIVSAGLRNKVPPLTKFYLRPWCLLFVMLNSSLNSIIFFWRCGPLRNEAKNVLQNIKMKSFS
jgi:hypothetical protein